MVSRSFYYLSPFVLAAAWTAAVWGCSASGNNNTFDATSTTSGDPGGSGVGGAAAGSGAGGKPNTSSGDGGSFINFDGGSDAMLSQDAACAATSSEAEIIPLDIIVLLDRSGSMFGDNWDGATKALKDYVQSPEAAGVNVGIVYFPIDAPPDGEDCNYQHYDDLVVPVGELPANAPALMASIDAEDPEGGGTPIYGAMKGALFVATAHQEANPTHKVILVFASDGDPNSCNGTPGNPANADTIPVIASLAESALNYNGVRTYAIAIAGASINSLNQIAQKGGTVAALDVTQNINLFLDKMKQIQASALSCDFPIPAPPVGEVFDKDLVAVTYTPSDPMAEDVELPHADNLQDCGPASGWYYDNNVKPTKIVLCPKSCQTVQSDLGAKINVLFGCKPDLN
jgi:hypothetical protein